MPETLCDCSVCRSRDPRNKRLRCSVFLKAGSHSLLIDPSPDFRQQVQRARIKRLDSLMVTHGHFDHIGGLDEVRPFNAVCGRIPLFASPETIALLQERFPYFEHPFQIGGGVPQIGWRSVTGPFEAAPGVPVIPLPALHGLIPVLGYRFGPLAYLTDVSSVPESTQILMRNLDCLVLGAIRFTPHPTHFNLEQALDFIAEIRPRRVFLTHITHQFDHAKVNRMLPRSVRLAYDGLRITAGG